jgi:polysaccharide lyase family 4-like protein
VPLLIIILLLVVSIAGCSKEEPRPTADTTPTIVPPPPPPLEFGGGAPAYSVISITNGGGGIRGEVQIEGGFPADTMVRPTVDIQVCGAAFVDSTVRRTGNRLANVVVWLVDARSGKPLPLARRFEIAHTRCRLTPRVQAVRVGGTLNIRSADRTVHHARFIRGVDGSTIKVVTEHDAGQVVPDESVLRWPGRIEVRCDAHPWTRGWILAFDHPYFDVTDRRGSFAMDSIPPGRYRLIAWHERFGVVEDSVTVTEGSPAQVTLTMRGR